MPKRATHAYVASRTRSRGSACTLTRTWWRGTGPPRWRAGPFARFLLARQSVSALELDVLRRLRRDVLGDDRQADGLPGLDLRDRGRPRRVPLARRAAVLVVADQPLELQGADLLHGLLDPGLAQVAVLDGLLEDLVDRPTLGVPEGEVLVRLLVRGVLLLVLDHLRHARGAGVAPRRPLRHQQEVCVLERRRV